MFFVDGLTGFREAIGAAYPKSQIQRCIIHQIRSSTRSVSYKDIKALMADLKPVYQAINEEGGMAALIRFTGKWGKTYDDSLRKMLYLASKKIVEHWTVSCRNWDMVLNQLALMFGDRISA